MVRNNTGNPFGILTVCLFFLMIQSCASLDPNYEEPTVTISSFRALPSEGLVPRFEIGLHILNPNASNFQLEGIVYTVSIQGYEIVKGVGKNFPVLEAYSEQALKLTAVANLLAGVRLVTDLIKSTNENIEYQFEARLDTAGFGRSIRVSEHGSFRMDGTHKTQHFSTNAPKP